MSTSKKCVTSRSHRESNRKFYKIDTKTLRHTGRYETLFWSHCTALTSTALTVFILPLERWLESGIWLDAERSVACVFIVVYLVELSLAPLNVGTERVLLRESFVLVRSIDMRGKDVCAFDIWKLFFFNFRVFEQCAVFWTLDVFVYD